MWAGTLSYSEQTGLGRVAFEDRDLSEEEWKEFPQPPTALWAASQKVMPYVSNLVCRRRKICAPLEGSLRL